MRCTIGEVDMMEMPLPVHEPATPPPDSHYPHLADDDIAAPPSPTSGVTPWGLGPQFQQGFVDCAQEAVRFLIEEEGLSADNPLVVGLKQHLLLNAVPAFGAVCTASQPTFCNPGMTQSSNLGARKQAPSVYPLKNELNLETSYSTSPNVNCTSALPVSVQCSRDIVSRNCTPDVSLFSSTAPTTQLSEHPALSSAPQTALSTNESLISERDLMGVLSCLTYVHSSPSHASHEIHQHSCHQMDLLPSRGRELSFTSTDSDADSSLNVTSVSDSSDVSFSDVRSSVSDANDVSFSDVTTSASDGSGVVTKVSDSNDVSFAEDIAVTDVSQIEEGTDSVFVENQREIISSESFSVVTSTTTSANSDLSSTTPTSQQLPPPPQTPTTVTGTTQESTLSLPVNSLPSVSLFSTLLAVSGANLSPEEVRIRSLAHEILSLLQEEAEAGSDVDDDDAMDDAYDYDVEGEDMVIEIEQ